MKKTIAIVLIIICILSLNVVFAANTDKIEETQKEMASMKDKMEIKKEEYTKKYGAEEYWLAGYVIEEIVQPYSIPFCFLGIVIGLVFQYVMGTRRLDYKHRGFGTVIVFVTILVVCQVLPFVYALVVTGWRG